jgi:ribosomal protein S21
MSTKFRDDKKFSGLTVEVRNDDFGRALRNWSKKVEESGLLKDLKDRLSYEPPSIEKQRMKKQARKRWERKVEEMIDKGHWDKNRNY